MAGCIGRGDQLRSIVGRRDQIITYGIVINGSEPQVCEKVSGTEPDFVQKLGTEPKFSGDAASLSCLRVNHSFGRMYLARRRTSFNSLAPSRNHKRIWHRCHEGQTRISPIFTRQNAEYAAPIRFLQMTTRSSSLLGVLSLAWSMNSMTRLGLRRQGGRFPSGNRNLNTLIISHQPNSLASSIP